LKVSDDVSLVEEIATHKVLVGSAGLWNCSDENVFKKKVEKNFRNSLRGKKISIGCPF
jgi:hypothetical protein